MMKTLALIALVAAVSPLAWAANIDVAVLNFALNLEYLEVGSSASEHISLCTPPLTQGADLRVEASCTGYHRRHDLPGLPNTQHTPRLEPTFPCHTQANFYSCAAYGKPIDKSLWGSKGVAPIGCKKGEKCASPARTRP